MAAPIQFFVSGILAQLGTRYALNVGCDGIDDLCWGVLINSQTVFSQFLTKHAGPYNYLILDDMIDGAPMIRLVKRAVNADLVIDAAVNQKDFIVADPNSEPAIKYSRKDPASLPRTVELQYISFDRDFAVNTQYARNEGARVQQNIYSASVDFVLSDDQARAMAYDLLWRMWRQQLSVSFNHPDLTIEPIDIVQVTSDQGVFVIQVLTSLITKEPNGAEGGGRINQITGNLLLTRQGTIINPGQVNTSSSIGAFHLNVNPTVQGIGLGGRVFSKAITTTQGQAVTVTTIKHP